MSEQKAQFSDRTLEVWQPRSPRQLTSEDARQIAENSAGFFTILLEWAALEASSTEPTSDEESTRSNPVDREAE